MCEELIFEEGDMRVVQREAQDPLIERWLRDIQSNANGPLIGELGSLLARPPLMLSTAENPFTALKYRFPTRPQRKKCASNGRFLQLQENPEPEPEFTPAESYILHEVDDGVGGSQKPEQSCPSSDDSQDRESALPERNPPAEGAQNHEAALPPSNPRPKDAQNRETALPNPATPADPPQPGTPASLVWSEYSYGSIQPPYYEHPPNEPPPCDKCYK
ncbi:hypothetical protein BCR34DRAFT_610326 [Clohesyomyces aquaticus]|uniref:Uncharacterized protein n=1 Tax=Clohesyomyces aquaticus TaxID=1231657 RepID=A0A1Y2A766_9PLEO|nr:hypothetical protein BCR34DRAFT_610326 [Clohesyomyces aquaticus]